MTTPVTSMSSVSSEKTDDISGVTVLKSNLSRNTGSVVVTRTTGVE